MCAQNSNSGLGIKTSVYVLAEHMWQNEVFTAAFAILTIETGAIDRAVSICSRHILEATCAVLLYECFHLRQ